MVSKTYAAGLQALKGVTLTIPAGAATFPSAASASGSLALAGMPEERELIGELAGISTPLIDEPHHCTGPGKGFEWVVSGAAPDLVGPLDCLRHP